MLENYILLRLSHLDIECEMAQKENHYRQRIEELEGQLYHKKVSSIFVHLFLYRDLFSGGSGISDIFGGGGEQPGGVQTKESI